VELSFNGKGSSHNTLIGGTVSLVIKSFMFFYIVTLFYKLFTFGDDTTKTDIKQTKGEKLGTVFLNETGYTPSFSLVNVTTQQGIKINENMKRHIDISIEMAFIDYTEGFNEEY
jgi:hypothetical protein